MASPFSSFALHNSFSNSSRPLICCRDQSLPLIHSQFLSSKSFLNLKKQSLLSRQQLKKLKSTQRSQSFSIVYSAQSNFVKVLQTVWKVGKDGIEAGTNLVPDAVPRPIARISITVVGLTVSLFVLRSFLSTAFFVLATMGLIYFIFIALNKDEGPRGGGGTDSTTDSTSTDDTLEEARRIMEKYK